MFNGIIKYTGRINKIIKKNGDCNIELFSNIKFSKNEIGSSVSCSGTCLTLEKTKGKISNFYISIETLRKTNFKTAKKNDLINLEKSLKFGDRISGHFVQGHVDTTCSVETIYVTGKSWIINLKLDKKYKKNLIKKGSITINGISLTILKILKHGFQVVIIPHTLKSTNLINLKKRNLVNIEFDVLGKYINNFLSN